MAVGDRRSINDCLAKRIQAYSSKQFMVEVVTKPSQTRGIKSLLALTSCGAVNMNPITSERVGSSDHSRGAFDLRNQVTFTTVWSPKRNELVLQWGLLIVTGFPTSPIRRLIERTNVLSDRIRFRLPNENHRSCLETRRRGHCSPCSSKHGRLEPVIPSIVSVVVGQISSMFYLPEGLRLLHLWSSFRGRWRANRTVAVRCRGQFR